MERGGIEIEICDLNEAFVRDMASKLKFLATFWVNLSYATEGNVMTESLQWAYHSPPIQLGTISSHKTAQPNWGELITR